MASTVRNARAGAANIELMMLLVVAALIGTLIFRFWDGAPTWVWVVYGVLAGAVLVVNIVWAVTAEKGRRF